MQMIDLSFLCVSFGWFRHATKIFPVNVREEPPKVILFSFTFVSIPLFEYLRLLQQMLVDETLPMCGKANFRELLRLDMLSFAFASLITQSVAKTS